MIESFISNIRRYLGHPIRHVFDLGSRDGAQAIELSAAFPGATVHAFECNPQTIPACRAAVAPHPRVRLVERAVYDQDGTTTFFPIDTERNVSKDWPDGNPGASSLYEALGNCPGEMMAQRRIQVPCTRLDTYCLAEGISHVDVIWADLQGAELVALRGLGDVAFDFLHTEVSHRGWYRGQVLFPELDAWLTERGFRRLIAPRPVEEEDIDYAHARVMT